MGPVNRTGYSEWFCDRVATEEIDISSHYHHMDGISVTSVALVAMDRVISHFSFLISDS